MSKCTEESLASQISSSLRSSSGSQAGISLLRARRDESTRRLLSLHFRRRKYISDWTKVAEFVHHTHKTETVAEPEGKAGVAC